MDWALCIICQKSTHEDVRCPLNGPGDGDKSKVYASFLANVNEFRRIDQLPVSLKFEEDITVELLVNCQAKWHKSCYLKFNDNKLQRARKRECSQSTDDENVTQKRFRAQRQSLESSKCIFCTKDDAAGQLHEFRTFDADDNIRRMATDLQDTELLAKISGGDLTAIEAKYHLPCLTTLRNKHRSYLRQNQSCSDDREQDTNEARAFVELITHVENCLENGIFCFKFCSLRQMYERRLQMLGINKTVNKTFFKAKLLSHFSSAQEQKNVILVFEQGIQQMLKTFMQSSDKEDALILAKAAKNCAQRNYFDDEARRQLFCQKNRTMESIPPTQDFLLQHCRQVAYQSGIWASSYIVT